MSWSESIVWSLVRAAVIALIGTAVASQTLKVLNASNGRQRVWIWACVLAPFFIPSLVTGYCFRDTSMSLVHHPWLRELLYALIVLAQSAPVAVVIFRFSPAPATTESAMFTSQILRLRPRNRFLLWMSSRDQYHLTAWCLLFLIAFQEADLGALMQSSGWPEWMFTKHAAGLILSETIRLTLIPVAIQVPFLIAVVMWLGHDSRDSNQLVSEERTSTGAVAATFGWIAVAQLVTLVIPGWQLLRGMWVGSGSLLEQPSTPREIGDALLLSGTVTCITLGIATTFLRFQNLIPVPIRWGVLCLLLVPGLMGNLALGLMISGFFQTTPLQFAYDTPIPLIVGEVAILMPRVLVLLQCMNQLRMPSARHFVNLLRQSMVHGQRQMAAELQWQTSGRLWFAVFAIVGFWAYFEVMLPSLLAMPGFAPVGLVLYNHLHYGQITAVGAKVSLALLVPFVLAGFFLFTRRMLRKR